MDRPLGRREMLQRGTLGFGWLALTAMLADEGLLGGEPVGSHPQGTHHRPTAKSVIFLFMSGGPGQTDTWDPKPTLQKLDGKPMPKSVTEGQPIAQLQGRELKEYL